MQTTITHRPASEIEADLKAATIARNNFRAVANEGGQGFVDESEIARLSAELIAAQKAAGPLSTREGIAAQREWAKGQGWTGSDLAAANRVCLARGYSLADLQAAIKTL